ncbi:FAD dependent oxidoreductase TIGR03364 [Brevibacterium sanguinis]|uniref:FAD dependent oxidoreductase TIGR03364 n=2 Tax=Brevibacterium TaxID=1696 RepID=A0A366IMU1_9MICO|nr:MULTISPECIES: TIGR03364 family FAD-dependent oxidoreductase [Brevibacterium]RBP68180.1 FAD dependent oxidoreductase TIGR03364 [Brevibacterium sanguinis]RBP74403.1 FAD dependent oxidoreductase TIGR03364 [Brevibacterium celere]
MNHTDILVVGSGIIGLAHARAALRRGLSVRILDADATPSGASIRNFGHCCITGQIGEFAELADAGREHWLAASSEAGFWAAGSGAYVIASSHEQMAVLEQARETKEPGDIVLLDSTALAERITAGSRTRLGDAIGGAFLTRDLRVDPRTAAPLLAEHVAADPQAELRTGVRVLSVAEGRVESTAGTFTADHVVICTGHGLPGLFPDLAAEAEMTECALSMALATTPEHIRTPAAMLSRTSLLRYDAFSTMPAARALRESIAAESPELLEIGANVMFGPRPDGSIILGDSHDYAATVGPFLSEETSRSLLTEAASVLGLSGPGDFEIRQRWQGVYASSSARPLIVETIDERTTVATVATGIGMTVAFGLAERTLTALRPKTHAAA